jgi:hypothetical protein
MSHLDLPTNFLLNKRLSVWVKIHLQLMSQSCLCAKTNGLPFDRSLKDKYLEVRLSELCYTEYPELADEAISVLLPFSITHLSKAGVQLQLL